MPAERQDLQATSLGASSPPSFARLRPYTKLSISVPAETEKAAAVYISACTPEQVSQEMDDPDVDHELIALLRESLGISNKAQDAVSSDTGKGYLSCFSCVPIPLVGPLGLIYLLHGCPINCRTRNAIIDRGRC